jgi:hypothetical protein
MRNAGNFHPEWGYLAPAPSFLRTARTVIVATAIGATAGAAVVFSLVDHPAADDSLPAASVAARTLARPTADAAAAGVKHAATGTGIAVSSAPISAPPQPAARSTQAQPLQTKSGQTPPAQNAAPAAKLAASDSGTLSTSEPPAAMAVFAETPAAKGQSEASLMDMQAAPAAESTPADPPPTPKKVAKKHRAAPRYAARGDQPPAATNNAFGRPLPFQRLFNYGGDEPADGYFRFSGR